MKKETKKKMMILFIILTFSLSSVAFFVTGFTGFSTQEKEFKPLESYVVEGQLDENTENVYVRNGFTIVRYYYTGKPDFYIEQLPQNFRTNFGRVQIILENIPSAENKIDIISTNVYDTLTDLSQEAVFGKLCGALMFTPVECGLANVTG